MTVFRCSRVTGVRAITFGHTENESFSLKGTETEICDESLSDSARHQPTTIGVAIIDSDSIRVPPLPSRNPFSPPTSTLLKTNLLREVAIRPPPSGCPFGLGDLLVAEGARKAVTETPKDIALINGRELGRNLIRCAIGVLCPKAYREVEVDEG